ncbi:MAG TPA: hydrogenase maturation protease [Thermoanaerobaculia bacterium]|nr:hydrogenase maturation protease [Thermoanaerobaculia bacterium]
MANGGRRIGILGLGSVLMGDDGLGPYAVELLAAHWRLPPEVSVLDAGTPGPDLGDYLIDLDAAIVVDTVRTGGRPGLPGRQARPGPPGRQARPGQLRLFRKEEVMALPTAPRLSPHDPDLRQALLTCELAGRAPAELLLVGVVPDRVELGTELSAAVRAALPAVEAVIVAELRRLGVEPARRERPAEPAVWWQRPDGQPIGAAASPRGG